MVTMTAIVVNLVLGIRKEENGVSCLFRYLWNLEDCLACRKRCTESNRSHLVPQEGLLWVLEHFSLSSQGPETYQDKDFL